MYIITNDMFTFLTKVHSLIYMFLSTTNPIKPFRIGQKQKNNAVSKTETAFYVLINFINFP